MVVFSIAGGRMAQALRSSETFSSIDSQSLKVSAQSTVAAFEVENRRCDTNGNLEQESPMEHKAPDPPTASRWNGHEVEAVIGERIEPRDASERCIEKQMEENARNK